MQILVIFQRKLQTHRPDSHRNRTFERITLETMLLLCLVPTSHRLDRRWNKATEIFRHPPAVRSPESRSEFEFLQQKRITNPLVFFSPPGKQGRICPRPAGRELTTAISAVRSTQTRDEPSSSRERSAEEFQPGCQQRRSSSTRQFTGNHIGAARVRSQRSGQFVFERNHSVRYAPIFL